MTNYSQNDEQDFILRYFGGSKGRLLEVGAFDGIQFSNTRALLESGWSGVLIEPDPINFCRLIENSVGFDVHLICAAVTGFPVPTLARLLMDTTEGRGWATTISDSCRTSVLRPRGQDVAIMTMPIATLHNAIPFQFVSIDAEGCDYDILCEMPDSLIGPCRLLCVEPHDLEDRKRMKVLVQEKFKMTVGHETPENVLFVR